MWRIIVHAGAGDSGEENPEVQAMLKNIVYMGARALEAGYSALKAVQLTIFAMESNPLFNAGKVGGVPNEKGEYDLDSSMMQSDLSYGVVVGAKHDHPIDLVTNLTLGKKKPFRAFYAVNENFQPVDSISSDSSSSSPSSSSESNLFGTVGCVALDQKGKICAGGSTAGLGTRNKPNHRFGDLGMIGNGLYCNSKIGVCCSGYGETLIPYVPAFQVYALMEYKGLSLMKALHLLVQNIIPAHTLGLVGIDAQGNIGYAHNTNIFYTQQMRSEEYKAHIGLPRGINPVPEPEYKYNPFGQCPILRQNAGVEKPGMCAPVFTLIDKYPSCMQSKKETIIAPCSGNIVCVNPAEALITIFLSPLVKHVIYAPISGRILKIDTCQGKIIRPELNWFVAEKEKNARLAVTLQGITTLQMWLEVGTSWITHGLFLTVKEGQEVFSGEKLGELIIGSLAEMHFPKDRKIEYTVKFDDEIEGGKTILAHVDCHGPNNPRPIS